MFYFNMVVHKEGGGLHVSHIKLCKHAFTNLHNHLIAAGVPL